MGFGKVSPSIFDNFQCVVATRGYGQRSPEDTPFLAFHITERPDSYTEVHEVDAMPTNQYR